MADGTSGPSTDPASTKSAALVAYTAATTQAEAAAAVFYLAVAAAAGGDHARAGDLVGQARAADPGQVPGWINELAQIGQHHPGVLPLIPQLTAPRRPASTPARGHRMTAPTDLVVVLPGILGSTLRRDGRLVWAPSAGSALRAIATLGGALRRLELPAGIGDQHPYDGVEPAGLMPDLHVLPGIWTPVKGYDVLIGRLRSLGYREPAPGRPGNLLPVAYDWRLSCRYNAQRLATIIEPALQQWRDQGGPYADAQVVFVCHSMGGLIARWYIEQCGGAQITRKLITLGTPYRGAARALAQLVNGADRGLGQLRIDLTRFARSMPRRRAGRCGTASRRRPCRHPARAGRPRWSWPGRRRARGMRIRAGAGAGRAARPESLAATHAIIGTTQATATTACVTGSCIELLGTYQDQDLAGDATVPIVAACRADVPMDSNTLRRVPDKHGNLQRNPAALDEMEGILTARDIIIKAAKPIALRAEVPELALTGQPITVQVTPAEPDRHALRLTVTSETGTLIEARTIRPAAGPVTIDGLPPGAYTIDATGTGPGSPYAPVSSDILIWENPETSPSVR